MGNRHVDVAWPRQRGGSGRVTQRPVCDMPARGVRASGPYPARSAAGRRGTTGSRGWVPDIVAQTVAGTQAQRRCRLSPRSHRTGGRVVTRKHQPLQVNCRSASMTRTTSSPSDRSWRRAVWRLATSTCRSLEHGGGRTLRRPARSSNDSSFGLTCASGSVCSQRSRIHAFGSTNSSDRRVNAVDMRFVPESLPAKHTAALAAGDRFRPFPELGVSARRWSDPPETPGDAGDQRAVGGGGDRSAARPRRHL